MKHLDFGLVDSEIVHAETIPVRDLNFIVLRRILTHMLTLTLFFHSYDWF